MKVQRVVSPALASLLLCLTACRPSLAVQSSALDAMKGEGPLSILALGDSFTIGTGSSPQQAFPAQWVALLEQRGVRVQLHNLAVNGYNSHDVLTRELPSVPVRDVDVVFFSVGANDIVRETDESTFRANLKEILKGLQQRAIKLNHVVSLPQPTWEQSPVGASFGDPRLIREKIRRYNAILCREVTAAGGVYLDLKAMMDTQAARGWFAPDGLHPSADAHRAWAVAIDTWWTHRSEVQRQTPCGE